MSILSTSPPSVHCEPSAALHAATLARSSAAWRLGYNAAVNGQPLSEAARWAFRQSDRLDIEAGYRCGLTRRALSVMAGGYKDRVVIGTI